MKHIKLFEDYESKDGYEFAYTCVHTTDLEELEAIIDHLDDDTEVDSKTFLSHIPYDEAIQYLPTTYVDQEQLINDYHVRYYIGSFYYDEDEDLNREMCEDDGEEYYIHEQGELIQFAVIVHSAIEHVWKK